MAEVPLGRRRVRACCVEVGVLPPAPVHAVGSDDCPSLLEVSVHFMWASAPPGQVLLGVCICTMQCHESPVTPVNHGVPGLSLEGAQ